MEKARLRPRGGGATKNLPPSETNHLGTFRDGTRENRGELPRRRGIFFNIRGITRGAAAVKRDDDAAAHLLSRGCDSVRIIARRASIYVATLRDFAFR